jgi:hypothetical protein
MNLGAVAALAGRFAAFISSHIDMRANSSSALGYSLL